MKVSIWLVKSFLISQIYNYLEKKYNTNKKILDGCHWLNADVGIFGTEYGKKVINKYIEILEILKDKNIILEKFHITDKIYNQIYNNKKIDYSKEEKNLKKLNTKIILITVKNKNIFKERINDRIKNAPHYKRILQKPSEYFAQQKIYVKEVKKSGLESLIIDMSYPLNKNFVNKQINVILDFIK
ncbi:MAG: hypothetical protein ABIF17_04225 [Patescibacteria group bacterium]